jgi:hypothetical protein
VGIVPAEGGKVEVQESYLAKDHGRLLNYAVWAKYLAWIVLVIFAISAVLGFIAGMNITNLQFSMLATPSQPFLRLLALHPDLALNLLFAGARILFQGFVFFLVLRGMSLGLSMIAETDVNYRDRRENRQ